MKCQNLQFYLYTREIFDYGIRTKIMDVFYRGKKSKKGKL